MHWCTERVSQFTEHSAAVCHYQQGSQIAISIAASAVQCKIASSIAGTSHARAAWALHSPMQHSHWQA
jgi:hypothetical protein